MEVHNDLAGIGVAIICGGASIALAIFIGAGWITDAIRHQTEVLRGEPDADTEHLREIIRRGE